jgi:hypothetical protein
LKEEQGLGHFVHTVNWPVVFYVCFALFVLFVLHNVLKLSFSHFVKAIIREFRMLLGHGPVTRGKINAMLIIALVCLTAFYAFVEPIRHLIELNTELHGTAGSNHGPMVLVVAFFLICVTGILSVMALGE